MSLETWFSLANGLALVGWVLLAVAPRWRLGTDVIAPFVIPGVLAALYLWFALTGLGGDGEGDFSSLQGVMALFTQPRAVLAGWVHYLVFDLFIGAWEVRDARARGIRHLYVLPCLFFTLMLGPVGWGAYAILRWVAGRGEGIAG